MGSTSFQFLGFALVVVLVYNLHRSAMWRQTVLLTANLLFLASFSQGRWSFVPFAAFLILAYAGLQLIRSFPKTGGPLILIATIATFIWLKKYAFVPGSLFLAFPYVTVGLSYILFRVLHLMADTRAGDIPERVPVISYCNYTLNFTTLVSGPIQPYQDYVKMQANAAASRLNAGCVLPAVERIVKGLFKVDILALVASTLHARSLEALRAPHPLAGGVLYGIAAITSYPIFLYCNFSGYIDIVIGIGHLLGFTLPENFNRPFSADNFINFWSRWHITLSNWLKTYVYNPLLMTLMRRFPSSSLEAVWLALALFVTFFWWAYGTARRRNSFSSGSCKASAWRPIGCTRWLRQSRWAGSGSNRSPRMATTWRFPADSRLRGSRLRYCGSGPTGRNLAPFG